MRAKHFTIRVARKHLSDFSRGGRAVVEHEVGEAVVVDSQGSLLARFQARSLKQPFGLLDGGC
jgi:hypothetical protein